MKRIHFEGAEWECIRIPKPEHRPGPVRDLVMRPTTEAPGCYDGAGGPRIVVMHNGKAYELLWYAMGEAETEPGDLLFQGCRITRVT